MQTLKLLDDDTITYAYTFLRDCEDEDPIGRGVDNLQAYPLTRSGVHQSFRACEIDWQAWRGLDIEDRLIARIDAPELDEEPELALMDSCCEDDFEFDEPAAAVTDAIEPEARSDAMPTSLGMGRAAALARR